jgi:CHAT domain-containing protein
VGLTRAFLYAGAAAVCVSLWKVADDSTPHLMESFYGEMLAGTPKADALRRAQLEILQHSSYAHPFWWAPFVVVGQPR